MIIYSPGLGQLAIVPKFESAAVHCVGRLASITARPHDIGVQYVYLLGAEVAARSSRCWGHLDRWNLASARHFSDKRVR